MSSILTRRLAPSDSSREAKLLRSVCPRHSHNGTDACRAHLCECRSCTGNDGLLRIADAAAAHHPDSGEDPTSETDDSARIGNSGRNTLRGPHTNVFDAALLREFPIHETANLEFRWEVFNVSNTSLFGQPNNNFSSGAAGQITSLSGDPRVMQLALRLSY
jgi:hypothetical protein